MGALLVRVRNALREPLPDEIDVQVVLARTNRLVHSEPNVPGHTLLRIEGLIDHQPHIVRVFPRRHRPVAAFGIPRPGEAATVELFAPLDPDHVREATFPAYDQIDSDLRAVLERSEIEGAGSGVGLYAGLTDTQKAGMFNVFAKMSAFGFDEATNAWTLVERLYQIRPDRLFADVQPRLRDLVTGAAAERRVRRASGRLHTPTPGFEGAGSFKTTERHGNLQLTFFSSVEPPVRFKVDADIDDAAGLRHVFHVIRHFVRKGATHPYDIHQILVFTQEAVLPYQLA